jgi:hypothetical protein
MEKFTCICLQQAYVQSSPCKDCGTDLPFGNFAYIHGMNEIIQSIDPAHGDIVGEVAMTAVEEIPAVVGEVMRVVWCFLALSSPPPPPQLFNPPSRNCTRTQPKLER